SKKKLAKLFKYESAWDALNINLINTHDEFIKKIRERYFDLIILVDDEATLFTYFEESLLKKIKSLAIFLGSWILKDKKKAREYFNYYRSIRCSIDEIRQFVPVVGIEIRDASCLMFRNRMILEKSSVYFKRELPFDRFFMYYPDRLQPWKTKRKELFPYFEKIYGIPLGIEDDKYFELKKMRKNTKEIDILYIVTITNTLRNSALAYLEKLAKNTKYKIVLKESVPFDEYCDLISKSKITISIAGSRWECFRHYEAIALGSIPMINRPTIDAVWWHDMPEAIYFENTFVDFEIKLKEMLNNEKIWQQCFEYMEKRIENYMLHSKIIDYIVKTSLEHLS
ncbi:MAG: hypothetical protein ACTSRA_14320, partial [Promethearchaeota archaeon]